MCGIYGSLKLNHDDPSLEALKRRGPDSVGLFKKDGVILGQTRLAVVDEKISSDQPIVNGDLVLVCNGEIYNYRDVQKLSGYAYAGTSDCEAILHVYERSGVNGFLDLDGFYAFILYDKKRGKIILHKDHVGKKPLYILRGGDEILFGSTVTSLLDNYHRKIEINPTQVSFYLENGFIFPRESIFKGIVPVLPGEVYEIDIATKGIKKYFLFKKCSVQIPRDDASIGEDIARLLDRAVEKRVRGLNHPVVLFSGGIDSTAIALSMLRYNPQTQLVSIRQPLPFLNDEPYIRQAAKILKTSVRFVNIFTPRFYREILEFIDCLDQPLGVYAYYFLSALSLKAKEYGKVLFTGDGGDEVFYGYQSIGDWFDPLAQTVPVPDILVGPAPAVPLSPYGLRAISSAFLGPDFIKLDKATAEHQMEARCPYLDWDLMCYARNIPLEFWLRHPETKYPLKQILRAHGFPEPFINRKKIGFSYPFRTLMIPQYFSITRSIARNQDLFRVLGIVENGKDISFFTFRRRFNYLWRLFVLGHFLEPFASRVNP